MLQIVRSSYTFFCQSLRIKMIVINDNLDNKIISYFDIKVDIIRFVKFISFLKRHKISNCLFCTTSKFLDDNFDVSDQ